MLKLCCLILMSTVANVYSAVAIYPYEPKPAEFADQDGCWITDIHRLLPYEKPYYPKGEKTCLQYICGKNNETQLFTCGAMGYPDNCHLEYDYTLDYPKCCGTLVCDEVPTTTTEALCITVTEEPPSVSPKPREPNSKRSKIPEQPKTPESPHEPEEPKAPENPKTPKIPKTLEKTEPKNLKEGELKEPCEHKKFKLPVENSES